MPFYLKVQFLAGGIADAQGKIEKVELRAYASEMIYGDAAYLQGIAQERWPGIDWRIINARTSKYVVIGTSRADSRKKYQ